MACDEKHYRDQGIKSNRFGITEPDALFAVSFPGLTTPQVAMVADFRLIPKISGLGSNFAHFDGKRNRC